MKAGMIFFGLGILCLGGGADWFQFRGPGGLGVNADATPPVKWNESEGIRWKTPLPGPGSSSPIVVGKMVFVTCYSGYGAEGNENSSSSQLKRHLVCLDRESGKILWKSDVEASQTEDAYRGYLTEHGYASNTPASDGQAVYAFFSKSGVVAYDLEGKKLWQTNVGTGSDDRRWGSSASVLLYKDLVIVNASSEDRALVALDKKTGKQVWRAPGRRLTLSFSTPSLVQAGDKTYLVVAMPGEIWGVNPDTGKLVWLSSMNPNGNICPGVLGKDGIAYVTGGFQVKGTVALKVGGTGDVSEKNQLWTSGKSSYVPTPVLYRDRLLNVTEDGIAVAMNAKDGKIVYEERLSVKGMAGRGSRPFYASPVMADGRLYAVSRKSGVYVLSAGDKFQQIQVNPPLDDSDFNASPALVDKQIFLRSNKALYCIENPNSK